MHELVDQSKAMIVTTATTRYLPALSAYLTMTLTSSAESESLMFCWDKDCKMLSSQWLREGLLLDHPVGCLGVCPHVVNGLIHRIMVVDYPLVITSIGQTLFHTIPDQERGIIGPPSLLHS